MKKFLILFLVCIATNSVILANTTNIDEYYKNMKNIQNQNGGYYIEGSSYATIAKIDYKIYKKGNKFRVEETRNVMGNPSFQTKIFDGTNLYYFYNKSNVAYKETRFLDSILKIHLPYAGEIFNWNENFKFDFVDTGKIEQKNGYECRLLQATHYTNKGHEYCISDKYGILVSSDAKNPQYKTTTDVTMIKIGDEYTPDEAFMVPNGMEIQENR